jgi:two-component system sensor histidine kinase GlrK
MNAAQPALSYPRSFLSLLVAGFLAVSLPLAAALLYSAWNTERLAAQARNAVFNASQAARGSRSLVNRINSIERVAQQYVVHADEELAADYARIHRSFKIVSGELALLPLDAEQLVALNRTVEQEQRLYELLTSGGDARPDSKEVSRLAGHLAESAYEVLAISYLVADREVEDLRQSADGVRQQAVSLLFITIAVALALALTRVIARPIRQLDASIRRLGSADFARPIRVDGPQDLQFLGERLDWLRRRLTELDEQKNRFLRHVSHELKTPLAVLREGVELLRDEVGGPLAPAQRKVVGILRDNSLRLQRMIEELLDYQRALHDAANLDLSELALDGLLREVAGAHLLEADARHQVVVLDLPAIRVEGDAEKLRTVFDNLLGNALKFAPEGGAVSVRAAVQEDAVCVDVIDSGPGVPVEERESIFNTFFQGRARGAGRVAGSGLGLAIAREFVQAHGGAICAVAGGRGGHFRVTLPRYAEMPA